MMQCLWIGHAACTTKNTRKSIAATTEALILLCMMQINCSTNATDSIFANNSGSTSGGAIYTDVRAMSQYKAFESMLWGSLCKGMLVFMQM